MERQGHETSGISRAPEEGDVLPLGRIFGFPPSGLPGSGGLDDPIWDKIKVEFFRADPLSIVECTRQFTTLSWRIKLPRDPRAPNLRFGITANLPAPGTDFPSIGGLPPEGTVMARPLSTVTLNLFAYFRDGRVTAPIDGDNPPVVTVTVTDNPMCVIVPVTVSLIKGQVQDKITGILADTGLQLRSLNIQIDPTSGIVIDAELVYPSFFGDVDVSIHAEVSLVVEDCRAKAFLLNFSKDIDLPWSWGIPTFGLSELAEAIINATGDNSLGEQIRKKIEELFNDNIPSDRCLCRLRFVSGEIDAKVCPLA